MIGGLGQRQTTHPTDRVLIRRQTALNGSRNRIAALYHYFPTCLAELELSQLGAARQM